MRFVYATRPRPKLEFAIANHREAIPPDADVYAVCDGALTIRQLDGQTFETLTQEEQLTLQALITQSQNAEAVGEHGASQDDGNMLSQILRLLLNS